jgi:hypothetical protein
MSAKHPKDEHSKAVPPESLHDSRIVIESQEQHPTIHLDEVYPMEHPSPIKYRDQEAFLYDLPYETVERIEHAKFFLSTPMHLHYLAHKEGGGDVGGTRARLLSMLDPWCDGGERIATRPSLE